MGLEATVCEIEYLAPDLIINVTFDTYVKCYMTHNICLTWKIEFKKGIETCLSLTFFVGAWVRLFADICMSPHETQITLSDVLVWPLIHLWLTYIQTIQSIETMKTSMWWLTYLLFSLCPSAVGTSTMFRKCHDWEKTGKRIIFSFPAWVLSKTRLWLF